MMKRDIEMKEGFLHLPVKPGSGEGFTLQIWCGNTMLREFLVRLSGDEKSPYFFLDFTAFRGNTLTLIVPKEDGLEKQALDLCRDGSDPRPGHPLYPDLYRERLRPLFHFSSRRGWLNDPNGLVFADNVFHMYYQHNPLGTPHGGVNVGWGHAVSRDLVHWDEKSDVMLPWRRDWLAASGSALNDRENAAGCGKDAIIAAFTALGTSKSGGGEFPSGGQFLASSSDGGNTFYLFDSQALIPTENGASWRDPRLFRYGDHYCMAVYEVEDGVNCVSFYVSKDFHNWERVSRNKNLYECPDIFPLKSDSGEEKWVLYGADGICRIGDFDGRNFYESGDSHPLDYGAATYAGQTISDHPNGKRIHISWVRGMGGKTSWPEMGYTDMPFSQCMSIPCELLLVKDDGRYRVLRRPVEEVKMLRSGKGEKCQKKLEGSLPVTIKPLNDLIIRLQDLRQLTEICTGEHTVSFDPSSRKLHFENGYYCTVAGKDLKLRILADTTTMELFFEDGIACTYAMAPEELSLEIRGTGRADFEKWTLSPIWAC
jgi:fructan beta-fructosidase